MIPIRAKAGKLTYQLKGLVASLWRYPRHRFCRLCFFSLGLASRGHWHDSVFA